MKAIIVCDLCKQKIGEVVKEEISEADMEEYGVMFSCECGGIINVTLE